MKTRNIILVLHGEEAIESSGLIVDAPLGVTVFPAREDFDTDGFSGYSQG